MNRSVDGDVVAVQVYPESEWKAPADEVVDQDGRSFGTPPTKVYRLTIPTKPHFRTMILKTRMRKRGESKKISSFNANIVPIVAPRRSPEIANPQAKLWAL